MKTRTFIAARLEVHAQRTATKRHLIFRRACLWTGFLAFAAIAFGLQPAQGAVTEAWVHRYSNVVANATDRAVKVVRDAAGDIIVTGTTSGLYGGPLLTIKYSGADGSVLWQQRDNGPADGDGQATAMAVDGSGNAVVTGSSGGDFYTAKYAAADGALIWEKRYNGPTKDYDVATAVALDGSGNVVVTGSSGYDYYTAKYATADGALLWEKRGPGLTNSGDPSAVAVDGSGNVVFTGSSGGYYTAKYAAADGILLWEKRYTYNGPDTGGEQARALAVDGSGNVVVTGVTDAKGGWDWDSGGLTWIRGDYYTAKYAAADGALLWEKRYSGSTTNYASAQAVAVDGSGNVAVTGVAYNNAYDDGSGPYDGDYYTAKYATADGALLWERRYNGPANSYDQASAVAMDSHGNVVVTGDPVTAKYAAADGALLWEKRGGFAVVVVDGSGNVVVTGSAAGSGEYFDLYTAKYAAADGALLWEKGYSYGFASAVAVDGSGNVVVTGSSTSGNNTVYDYYTAKYAAADGALLWEKRYNGSANGYDEAQAVAVDGSGNVVVTGRSFSSSTNSDSYTAKYAATDGALLWEKRQKGPPDGHDQARAVAVDGSGNVVVTGNSFLMDYRESHYYTAKYAAADGALLWEKRFTGPGGVGDSSHCLALGADWMVAVTGTSNGGYATVVYREVPTVSIDRIPTGVRLRVTGLPNRSCNLERAPAVTGPWSTINGPAAPASGFFEYLDTNSPAAAAFYRASEP